MPRIVRRRKAPGKGRRPAVARPRRRMAKRVRNVSEYASLSETRSMSVQGGFLTNQLYSLMNTSLDQFTRAPLVAKAYQHFRIKYIQLRVKPTYDTFATGGTTKFHLYFMIDKAGAIPTNITLEGLKQMGAKPVSLDENAVKIGWKPSVLNEVLTAGGGAPAAQGAQYKISPWLNTNANSVNPGAWVPSTVDHLGVYWYINQIAGADTPYEVEVEVQFEFKKPLIATSTGVASAIPAQLAQINQSKDGIVDDRPGGDDELLNQAL